MRPANAAEFATAARSCAAQYARREMRVHAYAPFLLPLLEAESRCDSKRVDSFLRRKGCYRIRVRRIRSNRQRREETDESFRALPCFFPKLSVRRRFAKPRRLESEEHRIIVIIRSRKDLDPSTTRSREVTASDLSSSLSDLEAGRALAASMTMMTMLLVFDALVNRLLLCEIEIRLTGAFSKAPRDTRHGHLSLFALGTFTLFLKIEYPRSAVCLRFTTAHN